MTAIALLSGGLDSTVATTVVQRTGGGVALALTVDYGQRAAVREVAASREIARELGIRHRVVRLDFLRELTNTALVNRAFDLPGVPAERLDDVHGVARDAMRSVWVPNRNGLFIAIAATFSEGLGADELVVGFNREEGQTFPDNSAEFLERTNAALALSTLSKVQVVAPTLELDKVAIVTRGYEIGAPMARIWSCYEGREIPCRRCESCLRLLRALDRAGMLERFAQERSAEETA